MDPQDTIVALATPPGRGGVGVVRLSGPAVSRIESLICGRSLTPRRAHLAEFLDHDGTVIDRGIAIRYRGPASYTGSAWARGWPGPASSASAPSSTASSTWPRPKPLPT